MIKFLRQLLYIEHSLAASYDDVNVPSVHNAAHSAKI